MPLPLPPPVDEELNPGMFIGQLEPPLPAPSPPLLPAFPSQSDPWRRAAMYCLCNKLMSCPLLLSSTFIDPSCLAVAALVCPNVNAAAAAEPLPPRLASKPSCWYIDAGGRSSIPPPVKNGNCCCGCCCTLHCSSDAPMVAPPPLATGN